MRWIVVGTIALLVVDLVWAGWIVYSGLRSARTSIEAGSDALRRGELTLAASALAQAEASAGSAASAESHPAVMLAGALPFIGDDVHAVTTIATAAEQAASAGKALAAGLAVTEWDGEGLPGFQTGAGWTRASSGRPPPDSRPRRAASTKPSRPPTRSRSTVSCSRWGRR